MSLDMRNSTRQYNGQVHAKKPEMFPVRLVNQALVGGLSMPWARRGAALAGVRFEFLKLTVRGT